MSKVASALTPSKEAKDSAKTKVDSKTKTPLTTHFIAGGSAGFVEACCCHPLDTIKVRMQLSRRSVATGARNRGFIQTGVMIVQRETVLGLYKGLGAVISGIVPKVSNEKWRDFL